MTVSVIIFDFDGTLADTLQAIVAITNRLALEFGYKTVNSEEVKKLQNLSSQEIIRYSKIPILKLPFLLRRVKNELKQEIHHLQPIHGIEEALLALKQDGHQLGIVTSNAEANVLTFLQHHGLHELFEFVHSGTSLFGKNKVLSRLLSQKQINPDAVLYVGDETRDIEAAKQVKIKSVAVSWGFNSRQALARQNPDFLIGQPHELLAIAQALQASK
ncbi:MAG: HAD-IA family hydrolase [Trichocoleus desertorum ATA4-8-CV12]|nr:HAD-IA family hydrolase [Trichocoleus desertorum ATA4-8-CV12]